MQAGQHPHDQALGMDERISRRDYLNSTLLASGGLLLGSVCPLDLMAENDWDGFGGVGDYSTSNGNTFEVMTEAHKIRDRVFVPLPADVTEQFAMMFSSVGFDARRDIAGIILNRWGHAYLSAQPGFFFGAEGQPAPGEVLRSTPYGRIAFANSDLTGIMDHRASILEAHRAAGQLPAVD